jgi:capsular exopolysaccharide synthesis family protein
MPATNPDDREPPPSAPPPSYGYEPVELSAPVSFAREIQGYCFLFLNKLWLIGAIVLATTIAVANYVFSAPRMYTATATVQVELRDPSVLSTTESDAQTGLEQLNTIEGKFESRSLLLAALAQAGLLSSNSPAFQAAISPLPTDRVAAPTKEELQLVRGFEKHLKVALRRNSRLIDISVTDHDPALAARLANIIVQQYLKQDFAIKTTTSTMVGEFFKAEYDRLNEKVQAAKEACQEYEDQVGSVDVAFPQEENMMEFQKELQLTAARAEVIRCKVAYEQSLALGTNMDELLAYPAIATDPEVELYKRAVGQWKTNLVELAQEYREKNPKYVQVANGLNSLQEELARKILSMRVQVQDSLRVPYEKAQKTVAGLEAEMAAYEARNLELNRKKIRYEMLSQEATAASNMFTTVSVRLDQMTANAQLAPASISVVAPATPPDNFSSPRVLVLIVLGFVSSLIFGCALVVFLDAFNSSLRTVDDAESYLRLPVLAAFPKLRLNRRERLGQLVVTAENSRPADVELFRTLRANVTLSGKENQRSYLFTSSFASEGKTFAACNFAASLAQQGFRTLIMDLDLRRPHVEEVFTGECKSIPGTVDVLKSLVKLEAVAQESPEANLFWVGAGNVAAGQAELLSPELIGKLLEQALAKYERVVIDTPPVHPVKDALLVGTRVDAVILVVDGKRTARKAVAQSVGWLRNANAPLVGVVLNRLQRRYGGSSFRYDEFLGYGYGNYGKADRSQTGKA